MTRAVIRRKRRRRESDDYPKDHYNQSKYTVRKRHVYSKLFII